MSTHTPGPSVTLMQFAGGTYGLKVSGGLLTEQAAEDYKRLIAAAPEMLAIIKDLLVAFNQQDIRGLPIQGAARALLARIEGKES